MTSVPTNEKKKSARSELWEWIKCLGIAFAIALLIRIFIFEIPTVKGPSMQPTLENKQHIFVTKYEYLFGKPKAGDVVICHYPDSRDKAVYVKRIIGTPGDIIEIKDGKVSVNGNLLNEPYVAYPRNDNVRYEVPSGKYFVMGDNRADSLDSRAVGAVDENKILGHVRFVVFPFDEWHKVN